MTTVTQYSHYLPLPLNLRHRSRETTEPGSLAEASLGQAVVSRMELFASLPQGQPEALSAPPWCTCCLGGSELQYRSARSFFCKRGLFCNSITSYVLSFPVTCSRQQARLVTLFFMVGIKSATTLSLFFSLSRHLSSCFKIASMREISRKTSKLSVTQIIFTKPIRVGSEPIA